VVRVEKQRLGNPQSNLSNLIQPNVFINKILFEGIDVNLVMDFFYNTFGFTGCVSDPVSGGRPEWLFIQPANHGGDIL
jgi:hypothetical protein